MNNNLTSEATWVPRVTLVTALMAAVSLPWAHHLGHWDRSWWVSE